MKRDCWPQLTNFNGRGYWQGPAEPQFTAKIFTPSCKKGPHKNNLVKLHSQLLQTSATSSQQNGQVGHVNSRRTRRREQGQLMADNIQIKSYKELEICQKFFAKTAQMELIIRQNTTRKFQVEQSPELKKKVNMIDNKELLPHE